MIWEYITDVVETGGFLMRGRIKANVMNDLLNKRGGEGFELVSAVPVSDGSVGTKKVVLFFKRPKK